MPVQAYPTGGQQLRSVFYYLRDFGFQDFLLPVLLIFTLFFAVLQKIKIFKTAKLDADGNPTDTMVGDRRLNSVLAIVLALIITIPHTVGMYPPNQDPILLISKFLPSTAVVLAAVFAVILLLGLAGAGIPSALQMLIAIAGVGVLVIVFAMQMFPNFLPGMAFLRDPAMQALLIVLIVLGLVGYFVISPERTEKVPVKIKRWTREKVPEREGGAS